MAINFPDSPSLNDLYTDSTTGFTYKWDGEVWKSAVLSQPNGTKELGDISSSFDGIETVFALTISGVAVTPINAQQLIINLGGVIQNAGADYTVSGSNITFTTPPASGLSFTGLFVGSAISLNSLSTYAVEPEDLTTGGPSWNTSGDVAVSGVATISNTGSASTALYVAGGARITGILTVGSSSVRIDGDNSIINVGTGLTINSSGITAGFITATSYYGDGSNLDNVGLGSTSSVNTSGIITASYFYGSGIGITNAGPLGRIAPITYSPSIGATSVGLTTNIVLTFNKPLLSIGNTITLRTGSADGTIVESYDVSTSDRLTISGGVLTIDPTDSLSGLTTYFVVVPEGSFGDKLNTSTNAGITTYSFTTQNVNYELWGWGYNDQGAIGQNDITQYSSPVQIPGTQWSTIDGAGGYNFVAALKTDETLWSWGYNQWGQLGQNDRTSRSSPIQIPGTQWSELSSGSDNNLATKTDGTLWAWGKNNYGNLGQNNITYYSSPVQIPGTQWNKVSGGRIAQAAIKTDGTLWGWGDNSGYGTLGQNDNITYSSPVQIPGTEWNTVHLGYDTMWATKTDGTLWGIGRNTRGQIGGTNDTVPRSSPHQVPGTQWNSLTTMSRTYAFAATKTDGTLWVCGYGGNGRLGLNNNTQYSSPTQVPGTQWSSISMGYYTSISLKTDNTLWTWGANGNGQLGLNEPNITYSSPRQVPGTQWTSVRSNQIASYALKQTT